MSGKIQIIDGKEVILGPKVHHAKRVVPTESK